MPADESSYPDPRTGGLIDIAAVTMAMPTPPLTGHARIATASPRPGTHPTESDRSTGTRRPFIPIGDRVGSTITLSTRPAPSVRGWLMIFTASAIATPLGLGEHTVTVSYTGDACFQPTSPRHADDPALANGNLLSRWKSWLGRC
jgi:hypothetical protein